MAWKLLNLFTLIILIWAACVKDDKSDIVGAFFRALGGLGILIVLISGIIS
jgi:hypothetical protein